MRPHELLADYVSRSPRVLVGLMSGTSVDAVTAATVRLSGSVPDVSIQVLGHIQHPIPENLRVSALSPEELSAADVARLNVSFGEVFAEAALAAMRDLDERPLAIASHGQTIAHLPDDGATLQIGEPSVIAERTGILTVAEFRYRDMAAGGQGAPLVPLADYALFHHDSVTRAVQNIGGIANVTYLPAGTARGSAPHPAGAVSPRPRRWSHSRGMRLRGEWDRRAERHDGPRAGPRVGADLLSSTLVAFDTGPGNMVIDGVVQRASQGKLQMDLDGKLAAEGVVDEKKLAELLSHPFLHRPPPKTTGREDFGAGYVDALLGGILGGRSVEDCAATVTAFTARSIAHAYHAHLPSLPDELIVGGGGANNPTLMAMVREALPEVRVLTHGDLGISDVAKEAAAFCILANETLLGRPGNVPSATGARRAVPLGKVIFP